MSSRPRESLLFRLLLLSSIVFLLTVLMMVAATFSSSSSPLARLFDRHGVRIIGGEVGVIMLAGLLAMIADRRQTLKKLEEAESEQVTSTELGPDKPEQDQSLPGS